MKEALQEWLSPKDSEEEGDIVSEPAEDFDSDLKETPKSNYSLSSTPKKTKTEQFDDLFGGPPRSPESEITQREMDLAASIQKVTEKIVIKIAEAIAKETGEKNLCLAGGVALNCVANGILSRKKIFDVLNSVSESRLTIPEIKQVEILRKNSQSDKNGFTLIIFFFSNVYCEVVFILPNFQIILCVQSIPSILASEYFVNTYLFYVGLSLNILLKIRTINIKIRFHGNDNFYKPLHKTKV